MTTTAPTTKIVIVSGQEFSVPLDTDNEAIRTQLSGMGFADVASATIQKGKKTVDGVEYETIEFVKKAGTKGLDSAELAQLLGQLDATELPILLTYGPTAQQAALLADLAESALTFAAALEAEPELTPALLACHETPPLCRTEGAELCIVLDGLSPVAARIGLSGW